MSKTARLSELDALIDDLTVDAYGDEEQLVGFLVGADEALQGGEPASIAGIEVEVIEVDSGPDARTGLTARSNATARRTMWRSPTSPSAPTASSG